MRYEKARHSGMDVALLLCFVVGYLPNSTTMVESELSAAVMAEATLLASSSLVNVPSV